MTSRHLTGSGQVEPSRLDLTLTSFLVPFATVASFLPVLAVGVLAPFIAQSEGIDPVVAGYVSAALFATAGIVSTVIGRLLDQLGPFAGLILMFLSSAATWWCWASATGPVGLAAGVLFAGLCVATGMPAAIILCFRVFADRRLRFSIGMAHAGTQLAAVLAGGLLPLVIVAVGWRAALQWMALTSTVGLVSVLVLWRHQRDLYTRVHDRPAAPSVRRLVVGNPQLVRFVGFMFLFNTITNAGIVFLPTYANTALGLDPSVAARTTLVMGLASMVGKVSWGFARHPSEGHRWLLRLVVASMAVLTLLLFAPRLGPAALWVGTLLFGLTVTTWMVPATRVAVYVAGARYSGTATSVVMTSGFLGGAVGPLAFSWLLGAAGFVAGWGGGLAAIALASLALRRPFDPPRPSPDRPPDAAAGAGAGDQGTR
jgi:predicted MFS family arabinose efflux permease